MLKACIATLACFEYTADTFLGLTVKRTDLTNLPVEFIRLFTFVELHAEVLEIFTTLESRSQLEFELAV